MPKKTLVVLSGAGISAESGLQTFRDSGGLWEGYNINEVATPEAWVINPVKVLDFYNLRRKQASNALPNHAHYLLAQLEEQFDVEIITQNVDDLHERAGSSNVLHLHGRLSEARSSVSENYVKDIGANPIKLGHLADDGSQLRPNIVWFGEMVPMLSPAAEIVERADLLLVVGTSLVVYPAASLVHFTKFNALKFIVDPSFPEVNLSDKWTHFKEKATSGVEKFYNHILNI